MQMRLYGLQEKNQYDCHGQNGRRKQLVGIETFQNRPLFHGASKRIYGSQCRVAVSVGQAFWVTADGSTHPEKSFSGWVPDHSLSSSKAL
jgi:hypothetical protein